MDRAGAHTAPPAGHLSLEQGALIEPMAVACHDVRLGEVKPGEYVVVQGGGPIGLLVALVARDAGGRVVLSEVNRFRIGLARELGLEAVDSGAHDLVEKVTDETGGAGADVVFEVSGSAAGAEMMTETAAHPRAHRGGGDLRPTAADGPVPFFLARAEAVRRPRLRAPGFREGHPACGVGRPASRPPDYTDAARSRMLTEALHQWSGEAR